MKLHYNPKLKPFSRELRKKGVISEVLLWNGLKGKKMKGHRFTRQKPIGEYIVDFFCHKLGLVIEIDGDSHKGKYEYDAKRQEELENLGLTVLRIDDLEIKKNLDGVLRGIECCVDKMEKDRTREGRTTHDNPLGPP